MQDLLEERKMLLDRLNRGRSRLAPGHPALVSLQSAPLWEREWTGGMGILDDDDSDGDEES